MNLNFKDVLKKATLVLALSGALVGALTVNKRKCSVEDLPPVTQKKVEDEMQGILGIIKNLREDISKFKSSKIPTRLQYLETKLKISENLSDARILLMTIKESPAKTELLQELDCLREEFSELSSQDY